MSTDPKAPVVPPVVPPVGEPDPKDPKDDVVKFETHKKLLDEKKKLQADHEATQAKLKALEDEKTEREKKEAEEKGDLKKLIELERAEKKKLQDQLGEVNTSLAKGAKVQAVLEAINGKVEEQYWGLLDLDSVIIDKTTGLPDETSVKAAAQAFETKYALVIQKANGGKLPDNAAKGGAGKLTHAEWIKLPYKEKLERQKDVVD